MQTVYNIAVGGLVVFANYVAFQPILFHQKRTVRQFHNHKSVACIGDAKMFHEHGTQTGCAMRPQYAATLVNLETDRDEQVWFCQEHFLEVEELDRKRSKTHRWQDLPLPRSSKDELLYPPVQMMSL